MHEPPDSDLESFDSDANSMESGAVAARRRLAQRQRRVDDPPHATSPAASGPAGANLEGHVGAQYLLPLLTGGEARGLPGVLVTRVAFQRAGSGHPMDDVVVTGVDAQGGAATLELQAKRTVTFTASDRVFGEVVALACQAAAAPGFFLARHELAVAIARTSTKIEKYVQVVLRWARDYQDATSFFTRLSQAGSADQEMRDFVTAFRTKMQAAGAADDDEMVWRLLSRFQVLAFDLENPGSVCMTLARDRCAAALAPSDTARAGDLWDSLARIALDIDAAGGDLDAPALRGRLVEREYRLMGDRRLLRAREWLAENSRHVLADIKTTVHGVHVDRSDTVDDSLRALEVGRYLEIRGAGGVGKSAVLKELANRLLVEARVLVLAPNRVPAGGWSALRSQLGCDANARQLLSDIAGDGGGILLIDGIDRFDEPGQRNTIADLLREAAQVPGFRVVATARSDFDSNGRSWLPRDAVELLGEVSPLQVGELTEEQVAQLRRSDATLSGLLRPGHPAEKLVRNLYRLERLSRAAGSDTSVLTEAQMAKQWWDTGDGGPPSSRIERQRVLRALAIHLLDSSEPLDSGELPAAAIAGLAESGSLRQLSAVRVVPTHDVLGDWAIGCLLFGESERVATLPLTNAAPTRLARGLEIAARLHAELGTDRSGWSDLLTQVSPRGAHGSWRRAVLLATARSERSAELLSRCLSSIAGEVDAELLGEIIRTAVAIDSQPAAPIWAAAGIDPTRFSDDFALPRGPGWLNLITWSLDNIQRLPTSTVPEWVDLYGRWCNATLGRDAISPMLVEQIYDWLVAAEAATDLQGQAANGTEQAPGLSLPRARRDDIRRTFLAWCQLRPAEAATYLSQIGRNSHQDEAFEGLLSFVGSAASAAPQALTDLFIRALLEGGDDEDNRHSRDLFPRWDLEYLPASPARPPFLALLQADKIHGLRLVRSLVGYAVSQRSGGRVPGDDQVAVYYPDANRSFPWGRSYMMARSDNSYIVQSALMALEAWGHQRIEAGDGIDDVLPDILGPDGSPAAYLLVAVDLLLSHWPKSQEGIGPFASSPELLVLDRLRLAYETDQRSQAWVHPEPSSSAQLMDLKRRASRRVSLEQVLGHFALNGPEPSRIVMRRALQAAVVRLGPPDEDADLNDPNVMAAHALNLLDVANFRGRGEPPGAEGYEYIPPADEAARFARLERQSAPRYEQTMLCLQLTQMVTESTCPSSLLEQGVSWATRPAAAEEAPQDDTDREIIERAKIVVAALVLRDGSPDLRSRHGAWAAERLAAVADAEVDEHRHRQLPYNPTAIAAIGLLAAYRNDPSAAELPSLFRLATEESTGIVEMIRLELKANRPNADEINRSLIRLALSGCIYALRQSDHISSAVSSYQDQEVARKFADRERRRAAVDAELMWLAGRSTEPSWPEFPLPSEPRPRRRLRIHTVAADPVAPAVPRLLALADSSAANVLDVAVELWRASNPGLLGDLVRHTWPWTAAANGVGAARDTEPGERAFEWNRSYFSAALATAAALSPETIHFTVTELLAQLPEERLLVAAGATLRAVDHLWLGDRAIPEDVAVALRETIARQVQATWYWRRLTEEVSTGIVSDAAEAVATMFMCNYALGHVTCYVLPPGMSRVDHCLPFLEHAVVQASGSTFVAMAMLSLIEVDPHPSRLGVLSRIVCAWWAAHGASAEFWINYGIANRVRDWIDKGVLAAGVDSTVLESAELTAIIDILLQCGGPMAHALEERVAVARDR